MPYPFNNVAIPDAYGVASEVVFPRPVLDMAVHVLNNAVYYTLYLVPKGSLRVEAYQSDTVEHALVPSLSNFGAGDVPEGSMIAGIKFRNLAAGQIARVTVI
jgi:hypothetical protein